MRPIVIGLLTLMMAGSASAQTPPPKTDLDRSNADLSHKLNQSGGVIHPQESVDPEMQKSAPTTGTMPVIPPPGTPGSGSQAQPK